MMIYLVGDLIEDGALKEPYATGGRVLKSEMADIVSTTERRSLGHELVPTQALFPNVRGGRFGQLCRHVRWARVTTLKTPASVQASAQGSR